LEGASPAGIQTAAPVPWTADMKSAIVKRSIIIAGHKTSVSLEDAFWRVLKDIAAARDMTLSDLVGSIDSKRQQGNLSSAIRLFVLDFYREQISELAKRAATREVLGGATVELPPKQGR
jgi:predicted DNA-binding ribbon-helix-helix protein